MQASNWFPAEPADRISLARIAIATLAAIVAVVVANAIVYFVADAAGTMPESVTMEGWNGGEMSIGLAEVISMSVLATVFAGIVFAIISWVSARPVRLFTIVATVVFVLSLFTPFTIPDAPAKMVISLLIMHLVAFVITVLVLTRLATR